MEQAVRTRHLQIGATLVAAAAALCLGALAAARPEFLASNLSLSWGSFAILAAALSLGLLLLRRPQLGLPVLVGFVFLDLSHVLVRSYELPSVLRLLILFLGYALWRGQQAGGKLSKVPSLLAVALLLYSLLLLFSTLWARDTSLADERFVESLKCLVIFALVVALADSPRTLRHGLWTLVGAAALLSALGLLQSLTGDFSNDFGGLARVKEAHIYGDVFEARIAGPIGDPNFFAQILVMAVAPALFLAWEERSARLRGLAWCIVAVVGAGVVMTYSRGGALALLCVLALCLLARRRGARQVVSAVAVGVVLLLLLPREFTSRFSTISQLLPGQESEVLDVDSSFQERQLFAAAAWKLFVDHPVLGVGAGNYSVHFAEAADAVGSVARDYVGEEERHYPHNLLLEIAAETGAVGMALFGLAIGVSFFYLRRARLVFARLDDGFWVAQCRAVQIALVGYMISSLFLHGHFQRYLWVLFALAAALDHLSRSHAGRGADELRASRPVVT